MLYVTIKYYLPIKIDIIEIGFIDMETLYVYICMYRQNYIHVYKVWMVIYDVLLFYNFFILFAYLYFLIFCNKHILFKEKKKQGLLFLKLLCS